MFSRKTRIHRSHLNLSVKSNQAVGPEGLTKHVGSLNPQRLRIFLFCSISKSNSKLTEFELIPVKGFCKGRDKKKVRLTVRVKGVGVGVNQNPFKVFSSLEIHSFCRLQASPSLTRVPAFG